MKTISFTLLFGLISLGCFLLVEGFLAGLSRRTVTSLAARRSSRDSADTPWKQQPGESEFAYLKRLQQLASSTQETVIQNTTTSSTTVVSKGYMRVEEWNEQVYKKTNLTWEERVKFDGHRHGDRFMQNEILRKNLNYFG